MNLWGTRTLSPPCFSMEVDMFLLFAEQYNPEDDDEDDVERVIYPKSDAQRQRLGEAVRNILLFRSLDLQHFLGNWANLEMATQIAEHFDNNEDVRKVNSKSTERVCRNDKDLTTSGFKENENRFGETPPKPSKSAGERVFKRRVIEKCCH
ncbi:hypothetical protein TNCV_4715911 [Trichonephila clavipes]|nr:hypothetical protein TNCV_4715911 [Trichonephila clavipes]